MERRGLQKRGRGSTQTTKDGFVERQRSKDDHIQLVNCFTKQAAVYPLGLCDAFIDGMIMEEVRRKGGVLF